MDLDLMQLLLSGAGGAVIGPLVSQFFGGGQSSLITLLITGIIGGVGAGAGADAAGISSMLSGILGSGDLMAMVAPVLEGGVGGGVLSTIAGMVMKKN